MSDTVRAALRHAASMSARARQVAWLQGGGLDEMADAERRGAVHRLIVLHHDADFETASEVIDFEHEWMPARGAG